MAYKYICNDLYEKLIPEDLKPEILFLSDEQLHKAENEPGLYDFSGAEVFVGQPFFMRPALLSQMPELKWLQCTGAGYDAADAGYIRERGITLTNSRGVMSISIAENAMMNMLFFARMVRQVEEDKRNHYWNMFGQDQWMCQCFTDLYGKTLGVLGYGSIGYQIALRARAFGMNVIAFGLDDIDTSPLSHYYRSMDDIYTILEQSDYVSINLPLLPSTYHLFNDEAFRHMKPNAVLMNLARGPLVDTDALIRALKSGTIAGAACDVFEQEPLPADSPLWDIDNLYISSHKSGMGDSWVGLIGELIVRNLRSYKAGRALENVIRL